MLNDGMFWIFALIAILGSLGSVLCRSAIYAALCLIAVFMSVAGFYILNNADFLAMAQVIIYAVGLTILMLFAIMFTGDKPMSGLQANKSSKLVYSIVALFVLALLIRTIVSGASSFNQSEAVLPGVLQQLQLKGSTEMLGSLLFGQYALPFELASILLLIAMIGAIVIAKKELFFHQDGEVKIKDTSFAIDLASAPSALVIDELRRMRLNESSTKHSATGSEGQRATHGAIDVNADETIKPLQSVSKP